MIELDWIAILAGAFLLFVVPAIWYAPPVMGNRWMALLAKPEGYWESRQTPEIMRTAFLSYAVGSLVTAFVFFHITAASTTYWEASGFAGGVSAGFWLWLGSMATDVGMYGFEGRPWKLWPIDKLDRLISWMLCCGLMAHLAGM